MLFFQGDVNDWPRAVAKLPGGSLVKAIDRGDILRDVKGINPNIKTALRHYGGPQTIFDGRGFEGYKDLARQFFATFIDGTFFEQYAQYTDIVMEWNEYLASSHTGAELQDRIDWARAAAWVWMNEYRPLPEVNRNGNPIRLGLVSCPVGNDINYRFAEIARDYDCVLSYHAYDKFINGQRDPFSWRYHCGRWNWMDQDFIARGIRVDWMFGEAGPYGSVRDGWRHESVLNGDAERYVDVTRAWIEEIRGTTAFAENRILGFNLFISGATDKWRLYDTIQPELDALCEMIGVEWIKPPDNPEPPPPDPTEPRIYDKFSIIVPQDIQRSQYDAVVDKHWDNRRSIIFSADDWALTLVSELVTIRNRTLLAYNMGQILDNMPEQEARDLIRIWVGTYYPDPAPTFSFHMLDDLFVADVWSSPVGTKSQREGGEIWPGEWTDANPYMNYYRLGNSYAYHTGADLNLNNPTYDLDRNMPVYAVASGQVAYAGVPSNSWRNVVVVKHVEPGGEASYSRYAHLGDTMVEEGTWIKRGTMVGIVGRNMTSDGPGPYHLHFDISPTEALERDPGDWPGTDRTRVQVDYKDPKAWILERS